MLTSAWNILDLIFSSSGFFTFEDDDDDGDYFSFMLIWKKQEVSD